MTQKSHMRPNLGRLNSNITIISNINLRFPTRPTTDKCDMTYDLKDYVRIPMMSMKKKIIINK